MKITTLAQLEALQVGSVIQDRRGEYLEKRGYMTEDFVEWMTPGEGNAIRTEHIQLPATAYIPTTITQEQFDQAAKAVRESEWFGTGYEQAYAALTTLGISVEGDDE